MKTNALLFFCSCRRVLTLGAFLAGSSLAVFAQDQPSITSIRVEDTNIMVTVQVPSGLRRITLESRARLGAGCWEPRAVGRLDGTGGAMVFQIPKAGDLEVLRVRATDQEPLPASFYAGTNTFDGQPVGSGGLVMVFDATTTATPGGTANDSPSRDVVESDIWKIRGDTLYFFNQYRGLQIIDISNPDSAKVKGVLPLPASGEQMYLLDANHAVLLAQDRCYGWNGTSGSRVLIVDVENGSPTIVAALPIQGYIQESRLVGTALYVASQTYQVISNASGSVTWEAGTLVSSFDLSDPAEPVAKDTLWFTGWNNTIAATDVYLFVAVTEPTNYWRSIVHCVDITAPDGVLRDFASIATAGRVNDKFKLNLNGSVFTAVSEVQSTSGATWATSLETFRLPDPRSAGPEGVVRLGGLSLGKGERVYATRFDGNRVYVVTYRRIDPLWVVDLSDPADPELVGELHVPGYSTFIQPLGDRLVAVGIDDTNNWRVAVSLFDVHDPAAPALLSKVSLGENYSWSEANTDEKAFNVMPDEHLILLPYQGYSTNGYAQRIQLIDLNRDSLAARGVIEHEFQPRRAAVHNDRIVSISGQELLSVDATDRDHPVVKADLPLAWSVDRVFRQGQYLIELTAASSWWWNGQPTPAIRVTPADEPDRVLYEMDMPGEFPILGASVRAGRLYLAQGEGYYGPLPLAGDGSDPRGPTNATPNLFVSVYDVSGLPTVNLLGETNVVLEPLGRPLDFQVIWPRAGVLVLAGGGGGYWYPWIDYGIALPVGGVVGPTDGAIAPIYWGNNGGRLIAFDVSDATAPAFLSDVILATNHWWGFSPAFTVNDLVYLSHQIILPWPPIYDSSGNDTNSTPECWVQRTFLDVVDYADAAHPAVRQPVNIPGSLKGVACAGELLYTVGGHWVNRTNLYWDGIEYLDASAYDGVKAHLVDSLELWRTWPHPVLVKGRDVFVGHPAETSNGLNQLEAWTLSHSGRFVKLGATDMSESVQNLAAFGDLLAAQSYAGVTLFDATDPAGLKFLNSSVANGCVWFDLSHADGALDGGLWMPLGVYGVATVPVQQFSPGMQAAK